MLELACELLLVALFRLSCFEWVRAQLTTNWLSGRQQVHAAIHQGYTTIRTVGAYRITNKSRRLKALAFAASGAVPGFAQGKSPDL